MSRIRVSERVKYGALALCVCLLVGCVTNSEFQPYRNSLRNLEAETDRIEKRLPELEQELKDSLDAVRAGQADIKADMIDARMEVQQLRGELSSGLHTTEAVGEERQAMEESVALQLSYLQQQMQATEARLARIEGYFGLKPPGESGAAEKMPAPTPAPTKARGGERAEAVGVPAPSPKKELSAEEAYDMAYHLFKNGQMDASRKAFDQFVLRHPDSSLVDNALFWIGETYYREGDYENAVLKYQQVVKNYPKGSKGPDALLKMGYALEKMNEPEAAVAALNRLVQTYPKAPQAELASRKIKQLKPTRTGPKRDKGNEAKQTHGKPATEKEPPEKTPHTEAPS